MSAFGNGGGSSSLSVISTFLKPSAAPEDEEKDEQAQRTTQLEREVSNLTNENLKLKEQTSNLN